MKVFIRPNCCNANCDDQPRGWLVDLPGEETAASAQEDEIVCATGLCEKCGVKQMWPVLYEAKVKEESP